MPKVLNNLQLLSNLTNNGSINAGLDGSSVFTMEITANAATFNKALSVADGKATTLGGTLSVDGDFDIATDKFTVASATGNTAVAGTLTVTGETTLSDTLSAGDSTLASVGVTNNATVGGTLAVTGASTLTGAVAASSTLAVTGASTLASVSVTNNATVGGTLDVTGAATFGSNVSVTGDLNVEGNLVTVNSKEINIGDRFIYLAAENTTTSGNDAGIVVNSKAVSEAVDFTSGCVEIADEALTITNATLANLDINDFLQISNAATEKFNGIYEIYAKVSGTSVTLKTSNSFEFCINSSDSVFDSDTDDAWAGAKFTHVHVGSVKCSNGTWQIGNGDSSDGFLYHDIATTSYDSKDFSHEYQIYANSTEVKSYNADTYKRFAKLPVAGNVNGKEYFFLNNSGQEVTLVDGNTTIVDYAIDANGATIDGGTGVAVAHGSRVSVIAVGDVWHTQ